MDITKIDQNLSVQTTLKESDICFYDVRKDPFDVYGFYDYRNEPDFKRLPDEVAKAVNPGVALLYLNTAGGRVRFSTDSQYVAIHAEMSGISRRLHIDHVNLGFSGNGRAEDTIIEYLSDLEMSAFVSDYDHNAPNVEHLQKTHCKLYQRIREKHPDLPYIIVSRPDFDGGFDYGYNYGYNDSIARRNVIYETYRFAYQSGDRNGYFVDGESIFRGQCLDMCTVDGCHPNDMGFSLMASAIGNELERSFTQHLIG